MNTISLTEWEQIAERVLRLQEDEIHLAELLIAYFPKAVLRNRTGKIMTLISALKFDLNDRFMEQHPDYGDTGIFYE